MVNFETFILQEYFTLLLEFQKYHRNSQSPKIMFLNGRRVYSNLKLISKSVSILRNPSFAVPRVFASSGRKLDFITSESVDKEQLTPALQQYFKFKDEYKGNVLNEDIIVRLCFVFSSWRLL